ncbi:MAG: ATP-grasp domain-containing protein [Bacteroidetes bacterium]|nr:ATP-grasp domain-containing protein [Bacteroidota bacterium]MCL5738923.1 ATP-grasp domain-containing protein [Bacteroidota bacterium]
MPRKKKITVVYDESSLDISSELELAFSGKIASDVKASLQDTSTTSVIEQVDTVAEVLTETGYNVSTIITSSDINQLIDKLREEKPDLVFNFCEAIEGDSFQEMNVGGLYELLGIQYTGSNPLTLGSCLNKVRAKEILTFHKINVPSFRVFTSPDEVSLKKLTFPAIAKPIHEDASIGISNVSVVYDRDHLQPLLAEMLKKFKQPVLVEQFVEGREFNVAIVGNEEVVALPVSEIDFSSMPQGYHHIVSYEAKWMPESVEYKSTVPICPAKISRRLEQKIQHTAIKAYQVMQCRDYARVDMRVDKTGKVYVLEVNPNPDLSPSGSGFARSAAAFGWTYSQLINNIVQSAFKRRLG